MRGIVALWQTGGTRVAEVDGVAAMISRAVRLRRAELGMSQSALAEKSGLGVSKIGAVERGDDAMTARTQVRLARAFGWPADWV